MARVRKKLVGASIAIFTVPVVLIVIALLNREPIIVRIGHFLSTFNFPELKWIALSIIVLPVLIYVILVAAQTMLNRMMANRFSVILTYIAVFIILGVTIRSLFGVYHNWLVNKTLTYSFYESNANSRLVTETNFKNYRWHGLNNSSCGFMVFSTIKFINDTTMVEEYGAGEWVNQWFPLDYILFGKNFKPNLTTISKDTLRRDNYIGTYKIQEGRLYISYFVDEDFFHKNLRRFVF